MPNTFKKATANISTSPVTVYTVPVLTTAVVIGMLVSNKTGAAVTINVTVGGAVLGLNLPIPSGSAISLLDGKLVLEAADTIEITSNTTDSADAIISIMEIS